MIRRFCGRCLDWDSRQKVATSADEPKGRQESNRSRRVLRIRWAERSGVEAGSGWVVGCEGG